jgi:hypothetical protein
MNCRSKGLRSAPPPHSTVVGVAALTDVTGSRVELKSAR